MRRRLCRDSSLFQLVSVRRMLPNRSSSAVAVCGTRQVASYSCTMSGPRRGACRQGRAIEYRCLDPAIAGKPRAPRWQERLRQWRNRVRQPRPLRQCRARSPTDRSVPPVRPPAHESRRCVHALRRTARRSRGRKSPSGSAHLDLARLSDVAGQRGAPKRTALGREAVPRQTLVARPPIAHRARMRSVPDRLRPARTQAARRVVLGIGDQQAERAEHAGQRRHDHALDAKFRGDRRPRTADRCRRTPAARTVADRGRAPPTPRGSPASSSPTPAAACRTPLPPPNSASGSARSRAIAARAASTIQLQRAADQARRIEIAEYQVAIGDGRLRCRRGRSKPDRDRRRRCRGPTFGAPRCVQPADRAAAGAHLGQVDRRQLQHDSPRRPAAAIRPSRRRRPRSPRCAAPRRSRPGRPSRWCRPCRR